MQNQSVTRRGFLQESIILASPLLVANAASPAQAQPAAARPLKVVCIGGHPDDPESGCAGTLARYSASGHSVAIVYLTRGERGIRDTPLEEAARIRSAECQTACKIIGAKPLFFGQIDGATEITRPHVDAMIKLLRDEKPDIIFTHWPIDTHMDHQVASFLATRAWMALRPQPQLYFFEVNTGSQSQGFEPNSYVDVSPVLEKKKSALFAHVSQDGQAIWKQHHETIAAWRGREAGTAAAEAFFHLNRVNRGTELPGI